MKIGLFDPVFSDLTLDHMLDRVTALGIEAVELGTGSYPGDSHCRPADLLADPVALGAFRATFAERGLAISGLSCHGNPLHPVSGRAARDDLVFRDTVRLAAALGVGRVNLFSGCPGDGPAAQRPNWIVTSWPPDFAEALEEQWSDAVIPYWLAAGSFARDHGVVLGFEMHPGMVVYNPRSFLRLRAAVGDVIGLNLDPSHLFWQGIDPLRVVSELGDAIVHVHAKDTAIRPERAALNGVIDVEDPTNVTGRSWVFRAVGEGHDVGWWTSFVSALRGVGYDHVLSIEHEDRLLSTDEGLERAVATLRQALVPA